MKANERIRDVIGALQVEDQPCRRVQLRLESAQEVGWDADQHAAAYILFCRGSTVAAKRIVRITVRDAVQ